jgi:hypothetical protein
MYYRQLGTHGLPYERTNIMWTDILRIFSKLSEVLSACLLLYEVCVCVAGWHYACQILSCLVFLILFSLPNLTLSCLVLSHAILSSLALLHLLDLNLHILPSHLSAPPTASPPLPPYTHVTYTRPKEKQFSTDLKKRNGQVNMMKTTMMIWHLLIVTKAVRRPYVLWSPTRCQNAPP